MKISRSDQTCALGAALFGAVAAGKESGGFDDVYAAQKVLCGVRDMVYKPNHEANRIYNELYVLYRTLHDSFGTSQWQGGMSHVMKDLLRIRDAQRQA